MRRPIRRGKLSGVAAPGGASRSPFAGVGAALALLLALLLAGCTVTVGSVPSPAPEPTGSTRPVTSGFGERAEDERTAVQVVDAYWQRHFTEETGRAYDSPRITGGYTGSSGPSCGGQPSVPFNAFYCRSGDFLAWDEDLMKAGYQQIGDSWVYLIVAHEWGHAIQARLRQNQVSVAAELQADCFAGAALQGAVNDGALTVEVGDDDEIAGTLAAVADRFPWSDVSSHGNARQRSSAFSSGANGGPAACV